MVFALVMKADGSLVQRLRDEISIQERQGIKLYLFMLMFDDCSVFRISCAIHKRSRASFGLVVVPQSNIRLIVYYYYILHIR